MKALSDVDKNSFQIFFKNINGTVTVPATNPYHYKVLFPINNNKLKIFKTY